VRLRAPGLRSPAAAVLALAALLAPARARAYVTVQSSLIQVLADDGIADNAGFWATVRTAAGTNLLYGPNALTATGTTRIVFDLDGNAADMQDPAPVAQPVQASTGPGPDSLGDSISMARTAGNFTYGTRYTIVVDPHTGVSANTVQLQAYVTNTSNLGPFPVTYPVAVRMELDTMVGGVDASPLSVDDGISVITANTLDQAITEGVPSDWWSFDQFPSPGLVLRGVAWGNAFGVPATQPDAEEFCQWPDVAKPGFWQTDPWPGNPFNTPETPPQDTAVVLWYTNTGQAGSLDSGGEAEPYLSGGYQLAPGETLVFTTYVGLFQGPLGATPTPTPVQTVPSPTDTPTPSPVFSPTPSCTVTPTPSTSPTWSVSPTVSPSFTASPSFSVSPTASPTPSQSRTWTATPSFSVSPTQSQTWTASPSFTASPSLSPSLTASPTPTSSPSPSVTLSFTATPSASPTATASPSFSVTPSFTASPSASVSPTQTPSFTAGPSATPTATQPPGCLLTPKPPNPNPSNGAGVYLPYVLGCPSEVRIRIFDVAGERVRDLAPFAARAGANEEYWDETNDAGAEAASGVFIAHIVAQGGSRQSDAWVKMAVLR